MYMLLFYADSQICIFGPSYLFDISICMFHRYLRLNLSGMQISIYTSPKTPVLLPRVVFISITSPTVHHTAQALNLETITFSFTSHIHSIRKFYWFDLKFYFKSPHFFSLLPTIIPPLNSCKTFWTNLPISTFSWIYSWHGSNSEGNVLCLILSIYKHIYVKLWGMLKIYTPYCVVNRN